MLVGPTFVNVDAFDLYRYEVLWTTESPCIKVRTDYTFKMNRKKCRMNYSCIGLALVLDDEFHKKTIQYCLFLPLYSQTSQNGSWFIAYSHRRLFIYLPMSTYILSNLATKAWGRYLFLRGVNWQSNGGIYLGKNFSDFIRKCSARKSRVCFVKCDINTIALGDLVT